ncbi:hypothetical protein QBC44DRAFT_359552, partial [Cladorrhinum sp. PSN332]
MFGTGFASHDPAQDKQKVVLTLFILSSSSPSSEPGLDKKWETRWTSKRDQSGENDLGRRRLTPGVPGPKPHCSIARNPRHDDAMKTSIRRQPRDDRKMAAILKRKSPLLTCTDDPPYHINKEKQPVGAQNMLNITTRPTRDVTVAPKPEPQQAQAAQQQPWGWNGVVAAQTNHGHWLCLSLSSHSIHGILSGKNQKREKRQDVIGENTEDVGTPLPDQGRLVSPSQALQAPDRYKACRVLPYQEPAASKTTPIACVTGTEQKQTTPRPGPAQLCGNHQHPSL